MEKLYGQAIRKTSGVRKSLSALVEQNVTKSHPELGRWVKELAGFSEKVYDETTGSFDSFVKSCTVLGALCMCYRSYVVCSRSQAFSFHDQRIGVRSVPSKSYHHVRFIRVCLNCVLMKGVHSRLGKVDNIDAAKYSVKALRTLGKSSTPSHRFHLGERILLQWSAPYDHARSDWIGLYPLGVNKDSAITQVSSRGHWIGLYPDEWTGNEHKPSEPVAGTSKAATSRETGIVAFDTLKRLPAKPGMYELRYAFCQGQASTFLTKSVDTTMQASTMFWHVADLLRSMVRQTFLYSNS